MKLLTAARIFFVMATVITGCATQSGVYQSWGNKLARAPAANLTKEDVSLMLGAEPYKCEIISSSPMVGIILEDASGPTVNSVAPNGPAASTDIKAGDKILSINSKVMNSAQEVIDYIRAISRPDHHITIETQRNRYILTPKYAAETKQCYWEINAGQVGRVAGGAYVNQYAGSAMHGGTAYQRFFRATCRFADGLATSCQSNWQQ